MFNENCTSHSSCFRLFQVKTLNEGEKTMRPTVESAWDLYKELKLPSVRKPKTDIRVWEMHIAPYLGAKELDAVRSIDVLRLRSQIEAKQLSPQSVHHVLGLLRRILRKAVQWELYQGPLPIFEMPKVQNDRTRFLTLEEAAILLNELKRRSELWHDITLFALSTGLRSGEIFNLLPEHINLLAKTVAVVDTKSDNRVVPLNDAAQAIAKTYLARNTGTYLFTTIHGNKIQFAGKLYRGVVNSCGLNNGMRDRRQRVVFHTLRHTFASWLVQGGTPIAVVSHLLGHSDIKMTMRYAHLAPQQGREAVTYIDNYMQKFMRSTV
ncbi:Site-specific recombinase XerD [Halodesulfovibrio aestuarii]|uniref:Site-specific recombinase XerD n=2 Tax=Halodesulfovibrio aestuarii TaxID=126333 RepID=A0A8G2F8A9_9BACT|nr:Site-specific recombinase XerD [Halodesulfovibrio aestuarii]